MTLTLGDGKFELEEGVLSGHLGDPYWQETYDRGRNLGLVWSLTIFPIVSPFDQFPPFFSCESVHIPVRCWKGISGHIVNFEAPYGIDGHVAHSITHAWEFLPYATLQFQERTVRSFGIRWEGVCDLWLPEGNKPFIIQAQAVFEKIEVRGSGQDTLDTLAARLSQYIDVEDFIQHPIQWTGEYESGVPMCHCIFEPKA